MTRTATLLMTIGAMTLACSQAFTSANADAGGGIGGSDTGGFPSAGGASGSSGRFGAGGTRSSGGVTGTGARPVGGSPGSTGGVGVAGGGSSTDSGVITTDGGVGSTDSGVIVSDGGVASGVRCTGSDRAFPTFDKGCTNDASCVLVRHTTSCCGSQLFMGINHSELSRFQAAESVCDAQYPACGCASQGADAEDGTMVPWGSESRIVVSCIGGTCQSHYNGKTFACGTRTCTDQQYCSTFTGGPAGSPTSYNCTFLLGGCTSCSCLNATTACVCSEDQGFLKVSCAAP
jgi:hypothetical protein